MGEQQDREDGRAYAFIMKTLDASVGYRLVWALDRLGWRIATQQLDDRKFPAPYQSTPNGRTGWGPLIRNPRCASSTAAKRTMPEMTRAVTRTPHSKLAAAAFPGGSRDR
jgi:hypothetical protein